jgi:diketogulonate reductase-like aldo/keto reductase
VIGPFLQINNKPILRGYGGLDSEIQNFKQAFKVGFRLFDGAYAYYNSLKLREALTNEDLKQIILSSKIPSFKLVLEHLKKSTEICLNEILHDLNIETINILYLHSPDCIHPEVLDCLVKFQEAGKIQHLGLCNVNQKILKALVTVGYRISVVQNEINPFYWDEEVLTYCREHQIAIVGYRPFGAKFCINLFQDRWLRRISHRVKDSVPAVILQWMNQIGVMPIPHSKNNERIHENYKIPKWTLEDEEIKQINQIKQDKRATCQWEKFLNKDLMSKSTKWIEKLK